MQSKPDYAPDRERQLDEIILAYLNDADAGRLPERSDWLAQYPEFASELEEFLANQDKLEQMAAPLRGGPSKSYSRSTKSSSSRSACSFL